MSGSVRVSKKMIMIDISRQCLYLRDHHHTLIAEYPISSATSGVGEKKGSNQTPRGLHIIHQKIGENSPIFSIFRGRQSTGEIWNHAETEKDFILSRILWLQGEMTPLDRYIYIHGTHDEKNIGKPCSHGCIRMRNLDVIELFDHVSEGDTVFISEAHPEGWA